MKKLRVVLCVLGVTLGFFLATTSLHAQNALVPAQPGNGQVSRYQAVMRPVRSADGILSVELPADWSVTQSSARQFQAWSPRGESFAAGSVDAPADRQTLNIMLQMNRATGKSAATLILLQRLASPPLSPDQVVTFLLPKLAGGAKQNVRILGGHDLGSMVNMRSAVIVYQYNLFPQSDPLTRSGMPEALIQNKQVPMIGLAAISTSNMTTIGAFHTWTFLYKIVEAPQSLFQVNAPSYEAIFTSLEINSAAVKQTVAASQLDPNTLRGMREQPLQWWNEQHSQTHIDQQNAMIAVLGTGIPYTNADRSATTQVPFVQLPSANQTVWLCNGATVTSDVQPNSQCDEMHEQR